MGRRVPGSQGLLSRHPISNPLKYFALPTAVGFLTINLSPDGSSCSLTTRKLQARSQAFVQGDLNIVIDLSKHQLGHQQHSLLSIWCSNKYVSVAVLWLEPGEG